MKLIQRCMINGEQVEIADISLVLTLNAAGRGFISVNNLSPEHSLAGAMVQIDLGRDGEAWRYFSGYIERDQPAENGSRRLFIREAAAVLDFDFPCSMQHPTLRGYSIIWGDKAVSFYHSGCGLCQYTNSYITHSGSGAQLLSQLGRAFSISDYVWHPMPDGSVLWEAQLIHDLPVLQYRIFRNSTHSGKAAETASTSCLWKLCDRA